VEDRKGMQAGVGGGRGGRVGGGRERRGRGFRSEREKKEGKKTLPIVCLYSRAGCGLERREKGHSYRTIKAPEESLRKGAGGGRNKRERPNLVGREIRNAAIRSEGGGGPARPQGVLGGKFDAGYRQKIQPKNGG